MRRLNPPNWLGNRSAVAGLAGFLLSLVSVVGATLWLDPAQQAESAATMRANAEASRSRMILDANAGDELAMHMGGLVFGVSVNADAPDDVKAAIQAIRVRALARRHDGVRGYLAELGVAGAIDYPREFARYEKLVAAENANLTLETYRAANAYEGDLAMAMVKAQGEAAMKAITLHGDRATAKAVVVERKLALLCLSLSGSTIVFLAAMAGTSGMMSLESPVVSRLRRARRRVAERGERSA